MELKSANEEYKKNEKDTKPQWAIHVEYIEKEIRERYNRIHDHIHLLNNLSAELEKLVDRKNKILAEAFDPKLF